MFKIIILSTALCLGGCTIRFGKDLPSVSQGEKIERYEFEIKDKNLKIDDLTDTVKSQSRELCRLAKRDCSYLDINPNPR